MAQERFRPTTHALGRPNAPIWLAYPRLLGATSGTAAATFVYIRCLRPRYKAARRERTRSTRTRGSLHRDNPRVPGGETQRSNVIKNVRLLAFQQRFLRQRWCIIQAFQPVRPPGVHLYPTDRQPGSVMDRHRYETNVQKPVTRYVTPAFVVKAARQRRAHLVRGRS